MNSIGEFNKQGLNTSQVEESRRLHKETENYCQKDKVNESPISQ
jgi:hypothetical protein